MIRDAYASRAHLQIITPCMMYLFSAKMRSTKLSRNKLAMSRHPHWVTVYLEIKSCFLQKTTAITEISVQPKSNVDAQKDRQSLIPQALYPILFGARFRDRPLCSISSVSLRCDST